jgi:hypothetical protein
MSSSLLDVVKEIVEAAGKTQEFETAQEFHLKLEQEVYEPLVIESWPAMSSYLGEKRQISVAHYFYQEGDAIADPDILMTDEGYPIEMQQVLGYTSVLSKSARGATLINARAKHEVEAFMDMWAQNIRDQGWLEVAAKLKGGANPPELSEQ